MIVNVPYVTSAIDELDDIKTELYEAMMDGCVDDIDLSIKKMNKALLDIKKSYHE